MDLFNKKELERLRENRDFFVKRSIKLEREVSKAQNAYHASKTKIAFLEAKNKHLIKALKEFIESNIAGYELKKVQEYNYETESEER